MTSERFDRAITAIDAANAESPTGTELDHARRVTEWVKRLAPDAGEPLLLAARAHHIRRWTVPRSSYPDGRSGYLRWRRDLHELHAAEVGRILSDVGYEPDVIARVQDFVRKRRLASDPEVQVLEDALCLVFIETQHDDLAARLDDQKMASVVEKTLTKMSEQGRALAAQLLDGSPQV